MTLQVEPGAGMPSTPPPPPIPPPGDWRPAPGAPSVPPDEPLLRSAEVWTAEGRPPPCAPESEQVLASAAVLGAVDLADLPPAGSYYDRRAAAVIGAVRVLAARDVVPDLELVAGELRATGRLGEVDGLAGLVAYIDATPAITNLEPHIARVSEAAARRRVMHSALELRGRAQDTGTPLGELLEEHRRALEGVETVDATALADLWAPMPRTWLYEHPPARSWLLVRAGDDDQPDVGVLPRGIVGMLAGAGGASKTMALVQLCLLVASDSSRPWFGELIVPHESRGGKVLLALGEETEAECWRRVYRAAGALGLTQEQRERALERLVVLPLAGRDCALVDIDQATRAVHRTELHSEIVRRLLNGGPWSLVAIDPLARFAADGSESTNGAATRLVSALEAMASVDCGSPTVLVAHHTSQAARQTKATDATAARGVTGLTDGVRWVAHLGTVADTGGRIVELTLAKSNYSPPASESWRARRSNEHGGALVPLTAEDEGDLEQAAEERNPEARRGKRRLEQADRDSEAMLAALRMAGAEGLTRAALDAALTRVGTSLSDRTLTRRLDALEADGLVSVDGPVRSRARRYLAR